MLATKYLINKGFYLFQRPGTLQKAQVPDAILRKHKPVSMGFIPPQAKRQNPKNAVNAPFL